MWRMEERGTGAGGAPRGAGVRSGPPSPLRQQCVQADPVAEAFYGSQPLTESFKKLEGLLKPAELAFLRRFFSSFSKR
jgi:hypothetical protein